MKENLSALYEGRHVSSHRPGCCDNSGRATKATQNSWHGVDIHTLCRQLSSKFVCAVKVETGKEGEAYMLCGQRTELLVLWRGGVLECNLAQI